MVWADLLAALFVGVILTTIFAMIMNGNGEIRGWSWGMLGFFFLVFMAAWAGGVWITDMGPRVLGTPFIAIALVGLIVALLLLSAAPGEYWKRWPRLYYDNETGAFPARYTNLAFYWITILMLVALVIVGYMQSFEM